MKYPYIVNYGGEWYPAGADVPVGDAGISGTKANDVVQDATKTTYTPTDIFKMPKDKLIDVAKEFGIEDAEYKKANDLKKLINQMIKN